jgi:5-methylcytosine-specific restriction endonuclease McrA
MKDESFIQDGVIKKINNKGYVEVKCGRTWVLEHRLVVENFIGRKLTSQEAIHHINGNKKDNRIENLMLFDTQKEHKAFENKIKQFGKTNPILKQISERWDKYLPKKESVELVPIQSTTNIMEEA